MTIPPLRLIIVRVIDGQNTGYAQSQEDLLVWEFFDHERQGVFVEVGANEPKKLSQTYFLEKLGWQGVLIEPQPELAEALKRERPGAQIFQVACGAKNHEGEVDFYLAEDHTQSACELGETNLMSVARVIKVELKTLDRVLEQAGLSRIDFLSVDVEGFELDVFRGTDLARWQPRLILVEDHGYDLKVHRHLVSSGYELVYRTNPNNWYLPKGTPFPWRTMAVRWELFRKMVLGLPWRRSKLWMKKLRKSADLALQTFVRRSPTVCTAVETISLL